MRLQARTLGRTLVTRKIKKGLPAAFFPPRHYTLAQLRDIGNHGPHMSANICRYSFGAMDSVFTE